ncbi:PilN domain-containing protein [Planomonospora sp. ID67723]|uniref:PilN domain-containing protein n=1 Tax=Planomonospora sp. ID67723 TaxID=2738134 RepID=UPI0018C3849B|nr:PilN domain-containing protein [Planomonospora sp. ID67723]MBG0830669.1 PilN domain-containing protein [Planomonospora sp. ID67723]
MSTTPLLPGPDMPVQDPFRTLSVAADLLPPEIAAARRGRRARNLVLSVLTVFVLLLGGWYVLASQQTTAAEEELARAQTELHDSMRRRNEFSELVNVRGQAETINTQLAALLADDLRWARLLSSVSQAAPDGVKLSSITAKIKEKAEGGTRETDDSALPNTSGEELIGEVSITGVGDGKRDVAAYVDALGEVPGLGNPLLNDVREQDAGVDFGLRLDITDAALGGRYSTETEEGN